jgi:hypothetical protein
MEARALPKQHLDELLSAYRKAKGCRGKATPGAFDRLSARLIRLRGNRRQLIGKGTRNTGRHLDANCDQRGRMPIVEHVQGHLNISTQGSCGCGFCRPEVVWRKSFEDDAHGMPSRLHPCLIAGHDACDPNWTNNTNAAPSAFRMLA